MSVTVIPAVKIDAAVVGTMELAEHEPFAALEGGRLGTRADDLENRRG